MSWFNPNGLHVDGIEDGPDVYVGPQGPSGSPKLDGSGSVIPDAVGGGAMVWLAVAAILVYWFTQKKR